MYKVTIKTKYNTINMNIENTNSKEFKEICEQPYIEEVRIEHINESKEELIKQRDELLMHVVGTSYNVEKAKQLTKIINTIK